MYTRIGMRCENKFHIMQTITKELYCKLNIFSSNLRQFFLLTGDFDSVAQSSETSLYDGIPSFTIAMTSLSSLSILKILARRSALIFTIARPIVSVQPTGFSPFR